MEFQEDNNNAAYRAASPYFNRLYVDTSYSSPSAPFVLEKADKAVASYVPLFSGSYGLPEGELERDPLQELISHRSAVLKAQIEGIMAQLYERSKVHESNLKKIDHEIVSVDTELMRVYELMRGCWMSPSRELSTRQQSLERQLPDLERQRRDEYVAFWKDRVLLRKELTELVGTFEGAKARESILGGVMNDGI